jgi:hypothetical protein
MLDAKAFSEVSLKKTTQSEVRTSFRWLDSVVTIEGNQLGKVT